MTLTSDLSHQEQTLAQDRAALASHVADLKRRISFSAVSRQVREPIASAAGPMLNSAIGLARANPVALGVTAAGLAWLLLGHRGAKPVVSSQESLTRWENEGGTPLPETPAAPEEGAAGKGARMIRQHPLVASAAAMALGSLLGALLPKTRLENDTFGAEATRLRDAALATMDAERQRAAAIAREAAEELKSGLRATVDTAVSGAVETVERVGNHVVEQAVEPHQNP